MFTFFKGFPQHSVSHSSEQPNEEEGVGEEEREQVEGLHQAELRAAHQLSKSTGSIAVIVLYCNILLTKHVTHNINIMHKILKGHNKIKSARYDN
jgi:hypothetical protein